MVAPQLFFLPLPPFSLFALFNYSNTPLTLYYFYPIPITPNICFSITTMSHRITPPSTPVVATNNRVQTISSSRPHALPRPENAVDVYNARGPLNLDPPKADKIPTSIANYQSRWEREKSKARAEGVDIDAKDPKMIGPWVVGEMLGRGASGPFYSATGYSRRFS